MSQNQLPNDPPPPVGGDFSSAPRNSLCRRVRNWNPFTREVLVPAIDSPASPTRHLIEVRLLTLAASL